MGDNFVIKLWIWWRRSRSFSSASCSVEPVLSSLRAREKRTCRKRRAWFPWKIV